MTRSRLFSNIDFSSIASNPEFKEASVRTFIIDPLLQKLGYTAENIVLEKTIQIQTGSKKQTTPYYADYALKIANSFVCVIEAKSPEKNIAENSLIDQAFSYASHRDIRSNYFVLCNGLEFALFRTDIDRSQVLHFSLSEIDQYWKDLLRYLSPESFREGKVFQYEKPQDAKNKDFDNSLYCRKMLLDEISVRKRAMRRHFGVHGYFTKQSWDVVKAHIQNYSRPGDVILDPYGGSGVTAVEALMEHRKAINVDINPFANFLVESLIVPVNFDELHNAFEQIKKGYWKHEPKTDEEIQKALRKYPRPNPIPLDKHADVRTADQLFSPKQTAQLGLLKSLIMKVQNENIRQSLMLMFSGLVTRVNLTYHTGKAAENAKGQSVAGANAAAFQYYRYRIAPRPTDIDTMEFFERRYNAVVAAKVEMKNDITVDTIKNVQIVKGTATDLSFIENESVDYIYTDPPYGKKIPYLDLSAMWNAWLDLDVTEEDYKMEAIEGGEHPKTKDEYKQLIATSIKEMFRVLKFDRWLSFVFAHKDPEFWDLIINTAEQCGFEYIGAVSQKNGQTSFKKRQRPFTVLSGQLIINFRKVRNPKTLMKANIGTDTTKLVLETIEGIIAKYQGATLEQINDELILKGLELGFLDILSKMFPDLTPFLLQNFSFDGKTGIFSIPANRSFKTHIDQNLRIKYYLTSYLVRCERQGKDAHFDDIIREVMPSLMNGCTPKNQTILSVLKDIAEPTGNDCWRLKQTGQKEFAM
ncbi:MAG: type I restriction enzyme HsdR N-terminal domain-containing protein [Planctomycetaceae bacterium]|jgi:16S rRNA G966 N2-methylase RsmD|nr:type I restriction enzyme HsdR N-terminal domain-containing protein [Planctomycetaceae bacterium]